MRKNMLPRIIQNNNNNNVLFFPPPLTTPTISRKLSSLSLPTHRSLTARLRSFIPNMNALGTVSYLTQREAAEIDEALLGPLGFTLLQLMELAGLSVAASVAEVYKVVEYSRVLAICGPGNNGGNGLVAARHLRHFGYKPSICYPDRGSLYTGLVTQLESLSVPFMSLDNLPKDLSKDFDLIIDAVYGVSFQGAPQPPFDDLIGRLVSLQNTNQKAPPIVSVDIPSGWHVEEGDHEGLGIKPDMLVSLTAPKLCAKRFSGSHHFLGGRFVPPSVSEKYSLKLPTYPGATMCVRIGKTPKSLNIAAMRVNYISPDLLEDQVDTDPTLQFHKWFSEALAAGLSDTHAMALSTTNNDKIPSSRMVLLQGFDENGFVWFTNYKSKKGSHLSENPRAALLFYWGNINRQVRIEGKVERITEEESDTSYYSCPRGIQIDAAASKQSSVVAGRHVLYEKYEEIRKKYSVGTVIPKPETWGGFRLKPNLFEFWQGQGSRLHDRLQYTLENVNGNATWIIHRLAP